MGWVHCHKRCGAYLALAALALQIALSFGHVHLDGVIRAAPRAAIAGTHSVALAQNAPQLPAQNPGRRRLLRHLCLDLPGLELVRIRAAETAGAGRIRPHRTFFQHRTRHRRAAAFRFPIARSACCLIAVGADLRPCCAIFLYSRRQCPQDASAALPFYFDMPRQRARQEVENLFLQHIRRNSMSIHRTSLVAGSAFVALLGLGATARAQDQPAQNQPVQTQSAPEPSNPAPAAPTPSPAPQAQPTTPVAPSPGQQRPASPNHNHGSDKEAGAKPSRPASRAPRCRRSAAEQLTERKAGFDQARSNLYTTIGTTSDTISHDTIEALPQGTNATVEKVLLQAPGVSQDSAASGSSMCATTTPMCNSASTA